MVEKYKFKGHETFFFREGWLSKALFQMHSLNNHDLFKKNSGISKLGVGANMVKSIKYWLTAANLLAYNHKDKSYCLTELGRLIAQHDMYLEDDFTLWLLHINIVRNFSESTVWNVFFNKFKGDRFTINDAKEAIKTHLFNLDIPSADKYVDIDLNVLLNMYSRKSTGDNPEENNVCPLTTLNIISTNGNTYVKNMPDLSKIHPLIVLYGILLLKNGDYVNISDLENADNSLTSLFNINRVVISEYLEQLAEDGYIRISKTAGLDVVYIETDKTCNEIVQEYYDKRKGV